MTSAAPNTFPTQNFVSENGTLFWDQLTHEKLISLGSHGNEVGSRATALGVNEVAKSAHAFLIGLVAKNINFVSLYETVYSRFPYPERMQHFLLNANCVLKSHNEHTHCAIKSVFCVGIGLLEQWLSDVFMTFCKPEETPPRVLSDLLETEPLTKAFGIEKVNYFRKT